LAEDNSLAERVFEIVRMARSGEIDPLELRLTDSYRELKELVAQIDSRLNIDEMLNEILSAKVNRVQELARILASPEMYVSRLKEKSTRDLARLLSRKQPVTLNHLERTSLNESLERIVQFIDAMSREPQEDRVPTITLLPNGFTLETEDAVFIEDIDKFLSTIPLEGKVIFDSAIDTEEFDLFLKYFLYVIILVSQGRLLYNPATRQIWRPVVPDAT
jgi:hypothetical protein